MTVVLLVTYYIAALAVTFSVMRWGCGTRLSTAAYAAVFGGWLIVPLSVEVAVLIIAGNLMIFPLYLMRAMEVRRGEADPWRQIEFSLPALRVAARLCGLRVDACEATGRNILGITLCNTVYRLVPPSHQ